MKVPHDPRAEANVVACALARPCDIAIAPEDCYVPAHVALLRAVAELKDISGEWLDYREVDWPALYPMYYPDFERVRAVAAAMLANEDLERACGMLEQRYEPSVGRDAAAVTKTAKARRAMAALADAYNALGDGAEVEEVAGLVAGVVG